MAAPTWLLSPALKVAGAASRWLDRRLAIRIDVGGEQFDRDNPDAWEYVIRIFNGTNDPERIHTLELTFSGGAHPLSVRVPENAVVDRTHNFETRYEAFIVSAHEDHFRYESGRRAYFNGVRVRFHSGREVWRPARGFRPASRWFMWRWNRKEKKRRERAARTRRPA